jgi:hypothetical protein
MPDRLLGTTVDGDRSCARDAIVTNCLCFLTWGFTSVNGTRPDPDVIGMS